MQELTKRTEVQNKIRFLNDNKIPYDIYIDYNNYIVIETSISTYYYYIDNGYLFKSERKN